MSIQIRKAAKKDIPIILDLLYELGRLKPDNNSDDDVFQRLIKEYFSDDNKEIRLAETGTTVVGMASMVFLSRLNQKYPELYIPELVVTKNFQNQGVGKKLINTCIVIAKERKCHRIRLESGNQRKESHKFYKKLGFEQIALSFSKNLN